MQSRSINRVLITLILALSVLSGALAQTSLVKQIAPGVKYQEIHRTSPDGKPWAIYILRMDRKDPSVSLRTIKARDRVAARETVRSMSERLSVPDGEVVAAINGDFYSLAGGVPIGVHISQGELVSGPGDREVFGISASGEPMLGRLTMTGSVQVGDASYPITFVNKARSAKSEGNQLSLYTRTYGLTTKTTAKSMDVIIKDIKPALPFRAGVSYTGTVSEVKKDCVDSEIPVDSIVLCGENNAAAFLGEKLPVGAAASFSVRLDPDWSSFPEVQGLHPSIVRNGTKVLAEPTAGFTMARHPRTAIGWSDSEMFFVAVDGRQKTHSTGMTLHELADLMLELGSKEAANLDGGGSTTLVVRGVAMNRPSDGVDRPDSNGWAVVSKARVGEIASLRIWPETPSVLAGSTIRFLASACGASGRPVPLDPSRVKWSLPDGLGAIDDFGQYTAVKTMRCGQVFASVGDISAANTINVWDRPASLFVVPAKIALSPGGSAQLSIQAWDRAGRPMAVDSSAVKWSVSGEGIAISQDGTLAAGPQPSRFTVTAAVSDVTAGAEGEVR